ncbi:MAG TPA: M48 family metallopeptidase [Candidatus Manganitrophaceae bacterium]|nr:M48 family metallopeptidase [Candidatus Manganitrophaceae bacterium]
MIAAMERFRATCFGPERPPQGEPVSVGIDPSGLLLPSRAGAETRIPFEQLRISSGGFDHDQIILTWNDGSRRESLVLDDPDSKKIFLSHAPLHLAPQLSPWKKKIGIEKRTWAAGRLIAALILLPLLLAVGVWRLSGRVAGGVADWISIDSEKKIGDLIYAQTEPGLKIVSEGEAVKAVDEIGRRLTQDQPYPFEWHLAESPEVNAFAIPGGHVVIFTGLIRAADSPEELAGVMAHEIEHVTQRHTLKALIHNLGWQAVAAVALGEWGGGREWGRFAAELGRLQFGREQESEADLKGLARLKAAGINPAGMITFFEKLSQDEETIPLLSTHPPSADRAESLRAEIKRLGPWQASPLPYNWEKIKGSLKED